MRLDDFDFTLPEASIAQRPASPRDSARLLSVGSAGFKDAIFRDLPHLLDPGDLLVFNDTRVIPARLDGRRDAVQVSVTLHQAVDDGAWHVFARPAKRLRLGDIIQFSEDFSATVLAKRPTGDVTLVFDRSGSDLIQAIERYGYMPLPPYIRGGVADDRDKADYQTMFADRKGAVAAPTAALHFTPSLIAALDARGIHHVKVTLHVGAGTFLPVKVENPDDHIMHEEWGEITPEAAAKVRAVKQAGGKIVAVGTTAVRILESATDAHGQVQSFAGTTQIFIRPGYRFRTVGRMVTNFHLPKSTLFMLVAAACGLDRMKAAYTHAIAHGYRFYSYGDACLLDVEQSDE